MTGSRKPNHRVESPNTQEHDSKLAQVAREAGKISTIAIGVSTALTPFEIALQKSQTVQPNLAGLGSPKSGSTHLWNKGTLFAGARSLVRGYGSSAKGATIKTTSVEGSKHVEGFIEKTTSEREGLKEEGTHIGKASSIGRMALASSVFAGMETLVSQYTRNFKAWNFHAAMHPGFPVPAPSTYLQHFNILKLGLVSRGAANTISLAGFFAASEIKKALGSALPVSSTIDWNNVAATTATALVVGPVTNALGGVLYTNHVLSFNSTFQSRKLMDVTRELLAKEGYAVFLKGFKTSVFSAGFAIFAVHKMTEVANDVVPKIERGLVYCMDRLFKLTVSTTQPATATPETAQATGRVTRRI